MRPDLYDVLILLGLAALPVGAWMAWRPGGPIVFGVLALTIGVLGKRGGAALAAARKPTASGS
jgi:hypothetical protein